MKRVLAIKVRRLGDTVLWTSSLQALLDQGFSVDLQYPRAFRPLFAKDPRFTNQFAAEEGPLRKNRYDAVLCFHASPQSARLARAPSTPIRLIHFHSRRPQKGGSTLTIPHLGVPMKATERDLNVARALGWKGTVPATRLFIDEKQRERVRVFFGNSQKPWLIIGPESSRSAKEWPLEYYAQLAEMISDRFSIGFITERLHQTGSDPRLQRLTRIARHLPTPTLEDLLAVLSYAQVFVGSDSGPKHIAVALGVRTVTLFGPESIGEWHCYDGHTALQVPVGCRTNDTEPSDFSWCGAEICPLGSHACLRLIRPEDVVKIL